jgi:2-polyprenyl-6-methoxyphenol hydroxylase-like FAD-dependent oxidoreductase
MLRLEGGEIHGGFLLRRGFAEAAAVRMLSLSLDISRRERKRQLKIAVVGGGPAGLYFAYLWKRRHPRAELVLFEQNPADATFGFGVVFSDRALDFLRADDPETVEAIAPHMERWQDMTLVHRGERVTIDGVGFSAIGRLELLRLLQARAASVGVQPDYERRVASVDELKAFDLVVAADGVNSSLRMADPAFETSTDLFRNKFIWFGTTKPFETLTQTFVTSEYGTLNAHHYRYAKDKSTFIIECDRATYDRANFESLSPEESKARCERIFADTLEGHALVSNKSVWRDFPWIWNGRWSHGNVVLLGDALHTAHFSIGSGTRLALEDSIALFKALESESGISASLARYERERKPVVEKIVKASKTSAAWYENFPEHMKREPLDFAMSYITRSGRIDEAKLREMSPRFMANYDAARRR